jgi:hypothetical protein
MCEGLPDAPKKKSIDKSLKRKKALKIE